MINSCYLFISFINYATLRNYININTFKQNIHQRQIFRLLYRCVLWIKKWALITWKIRKIHENSNWSRVLPVILTYSEILNHKIWLNQCTCTCMTCNTHFVYRKLLWLLVNRDLFKNRRRKLNPCMMMYLLAKHWLKSGNEFITIFCD